MKTIKLVVCDIDGTLINRGEDFPQVMIETVTLLKKKGIAFTFASGRLPYMIDPYLKLLDLFVPFCACNGTLICHSGKILESHPIKISLLRPVIEKAIEEDMTVLYGKNGIEYCMQENKTVKEKIKERGHYHEIRPLSEKEWSNLEADKVNILDDKKNIDILEPYLAALKNHCDVTHYGAEGLEAVKAGYGKGYGIKALSRLMKIPMDQVMAIGDNENDNEMIKLAGIGGVVGNGKPQTRLLADIVAKKEGGEGAAELIRKVCLQEE